MQEAEVEEELSGWMGRGRGFQVEKKAPVKALRQRRA